MYTLCLTMHNAHVHRSPRYIIDTLADSGHAQPRATSFISEQQVRTARPTSQDRRASVLVLQTRLLEQLAERTNIIYGHSNFQIASENPSSQTRL